MGAAEDAYAAAEAEIARVRAAGEVRLRLGQPFPALVRLPPEIESLDTLRRLDLANTKVADITPLASLSALQTLDLANTQVADITPLAGLSALQRLWLNSSTQIADITPLAGLSALQEVFLDKTQVADITPLAGLSALQKLELSNTKVADFTPLAGLSALQWLRLDNTQVADITPLARLSALKTLWLNSTRVADLRPLRDLANLGTDEHSSLSFREIPALRDPELARLSEIADNQSRAKETLAYLRTLPPYPEPLPWEVALAKKDAPEPDPALPMVFVDGAVDLQTRTLGDEYGADPLRASLFEELTERIEDLIRISANRDDGIYREACRLRDRLQDGLAAMEPARVHLCIEALRRAQGKLPSTADPDLSHALGTVLEIGPGLTLGTPEVTLWLERIRENQLQRKDRAEVEAEARLAEAIADSPLAADAVKSVARGAADLMVEDQLSGLRTPLVRNWTVEVAKIGIVSTSVDGVLGNASYDALSWIVANADDVLIIARYWGDPVLAWIVPILHRAREMTAAGQHVVGKIRGR